MRVCVRREKRKRVENSHKSCNKAMPTARDGWGFQYIHSFPPLPPLRPPRPPSSSSSFPKSMLGPRRAQTVPVCVGVVCVGVAGKTSDLWDAHSHTRPPYGVPGNPHACTSASQTSQTRTQPLLRQQPFVPHLPRPFVGDRPPSSTAAGPPMRRLRRMNRFRTRARPACNPQKLSHEPRHRPLSLDRPPGTTVTCVVDLSPRGGVGGPPRGAEKGGGREVVEIGGWIKLPMFHVSTRDAVRTRARLSNGVSPGPCDGRGWVGGVYVQ